MPPVVRQSLLALFLVAHAADPALALTRPFADLPPHCRHIVVLQGEEDRQLYEGAQWPNAPLERPGPHQMAALRAALERMTPLLCRSVNRIAFARVEEHDDKYAAVNSFGAGDLITINNAAGLDEATLADKLSRRLWLQKELTHEAGHTAETLLTVEASSAESTYQGAWDLAARELARAAIERVRLDAGLPTEWRRLHESFADEGWARDWGSFPLDENDAPAGWTPPDVVRGGFMSQYASWNWAEDIADTLALTYYSALYAEAYAAAGAPVSARPDFGCLEFRAHDQDNLPSHYAALYTKLHFLEDLGLVHEADVAYCLGDHLSLPADGPGFHLWHQGAKRRVYDTAMTARLGRRQNGAPVFELQAEGSAGFGDDEYETTVKLRLDVGNRFQDFGAVSWPRGVYALGVAGDNNFTLRLEDAPAGNFDVMDGFALVTEASAVRIAGSVVIQRVFRLNAPMAVPERYDPPLVLRFLYER